MTGRNERLYQKALFIFRRDLRLCDNTGLIEAARASELVTPCFIVDPRQASEHPYFSSKAFGFMILSLEDLAQQLSDAGAPLSIFEGQAEHVITRLNKRRDYDAIFLNKDYTPFSKKRDAAIAAACQRGGVDFHYCSDALLHEPHEVVTSSRAPYTMFSHFLKKARTIPVRQVEGIIPNNFSPYRATQAVSLEDTALAQVHTEQMVEAGRAKVLEVLANMEQFEDYESTREHPARARTTRLSVHNKFGTCSIREVYHAVAGHFGPEHRLVAELYWRDFYYYIASYFPHVFGHAFHRKYDALSWSDDVAAFNAWCHGRTGFPIIDAGMRQLNETGFVHNRVRMLVASFLVKDLHIDWRWGERYFAQKLVDYDPAVNNGNWQWCASTGSDAQPYFRIFNPWVQQRKYDPDCEYVKTWLPELRGVPAAHIHSLSTPTTPVPHGYPRTIVDHVKESRRSKELYETIWKG